MNEWLPNIVCLIVGVLLGWAIAHAYYRRGKEDLATLRADIEHLPAGLLEAVRNAGGKITRVGVPGPPTNFKVQ